MLNDNQSDRYSRQTLVDKLGDSGQVKLANSRVLIVGGGGLGCTVAAQLAGAGVGELQIVDHDTVALSNLHRQVLFREADVGQSKAEIAAREMRAINSQCNVKAYPQRLSISNAKILCDDIDVVVDAADNFATTYLLSDACKVLNIALVSASVNRTFGHVGQFCRNAPSVRAVFPRLPKQAQSCDVVGVTGPSVGVIASLQAQETVKAILNDTAQLSGRLLYLDLWDYKLQEIDFTNAQEPEQNSVQLLSASEIVFDDLIVDVRNQEEVIASPHSFEHVVHRELASVLDNTESLPRDKRLVCACQSGQRALIAAQQLLDQGFKNVAALLPD